MKRAILIVATAVALSGCVNVRPDEKKFFCEVVSYGVETKELKSPALAGVLNILPGFGNFYLATGTDHDGQAGIGFLNLFAWPFSIVWGVPGAATDAGNINRIETVRYYRTDEGRVEYERLIEGVEPSIDPDCGKTRTTESEPGDGYGE